MILMMPNNSILTLSFKIIYIYIYTSYNIYIHIILLICFSCFSCFLPGGKGWGVNSGSWVAFSIELQCRSCHRVGWRSIYASRYPNIYIYMYICGCLNKVLPENCQQSSNLTLRKLNDDEWWASQGEKMRWTYHMALYRNGGRSTRILGHSIFKTNPHETPWNQLKHVETAGFYTQPDALQGTKMCPIHGYNCAEWTWMTAFSGPPNNHHGSFQPLLRSLYPCYNDVLPTRYNWGNNCWPVTRVCLYWHMFLYKEATCYILPFWPLESLLPIPIACHSMP